MTHRGFAKLSLILGSFAWSACNGWETPRATGMNTGGSAGAAAEVIYPPSPAGLRAVGNQIQDASGDRIFLRGVNRSGTEYECANGVGIFDGPSDDASIQVITTWNVNAVRVPLNESCWLDINRVDERYAGQTYKSAILSYVNLLHKYHLIPILELHWVGPGTSLGRGQLPMPDADHAAAFWTDLASTFLADSGVIFELFNEPYPDRNRDTDAAWACWRDGCAVSTSEAPIAYQAIGMQDLVSAVRATGATQLILLGGVQYSNGLSQWLTHVPADPLNNVAVAWHIYDNNPCADSDCWSTVLSGPSSLGAQFPIVATEIGESDCNGSFIDPLMQALDGAASGYLAWSWNASPQCVPAVRKNDDPGRPYPLIADYTTGMPPSDYAQAFMTHLAVVNP